MDTHLFKTRTGSCEIGPDDILIKDSGAGETLAETLVGKNILRIRILYLFFSAIMLCCLVIMLTDGSYLMAIFPAFSCFLFLYYFFNSHRFSNDLVIPISQIRRVNLQKRIPRSFIEIQFTNEKGQSNIRRINLPDSWKGGPDVTQQALEAFAAAGITVTVSFL